MLFNESDFTPANNFCPHPEFYHCADDDSIEAEVGDFLYGLVRALQPEYCIETGTAWGETAERLGRALNANNHGRLITLETNVERFQFSKNRVLNLPVECLNISSLEYTPVETIGFAFFDSLLDLRLEEFNLYKPFFDDRTIFCFHDTAPHKADYLEDIGDDILKIRLHTPRGLTICQLKGEFNG